MEQIDCFRKHGKVCSLCRRKFEPPGSLLERLLEVGETAIPQCNGRDCLLVQLASFPQSNSDLEHNLKKDFG